MSVDKPYLVVLSLDARDTYLGIEPDAEAAIVDALLASLKTFPRMGRVFEPPFASRRPAGEVRVIFGGYHGIYYQINDDERRVEVLFIEDQRRDPMSMFYEGQ